MANKLDKINFGGTVMEIQKYTAGQYINVSNNGVISVDPDGLAEYMHEIYGTPLMASTAAGMTDRTRIYVYTGSETGYNNGHWYYWNGSAWADGGVYNSAGVTTDKTLTLENIPADAKATGDQITDLKEDLDEVVIAYNSIESYLYAKDTYFRNGVPTTLSGYDTYKFPLKAYDVLLLVSDASPYGALGSTGIFAVEHSDGTTESITGQLEYGTMQIQYLDVVCFGAIPNISDIVALYITIQNGKENLVHVNLNRAYTQLSNDVKSVQEINTDMLLQTLWFRNKASADATSNYWGRFSESGDYRTYIMKMEQGDRIVFNKTITGVTGKARVTNSSGTFDVTDVEYTATEACVISIFDNLTVDGNFVYYPNDPLKISSDNVYGELNTNQQFNGLDGVAFGTSLTYKASTTYGYLTKLSELSGITFDNQGIGSATIKGGMLTAIKNYTSYASKRVCLLEGFVNDWYTNLPLGTYTDSTEYTVCGCVRTALNYILSQNANLTVFLILDHYGRNVSNVNCSTTAKNASDLTQYEYYEEIAKVAENLGIPVIKEYEISQISENTPQYLADNIHLNALGAIQSAYAIWSQMKQYYPNQM